ncbi:MAG: hypothetical protein KAH21_11075, partial [Spirochaetaceae bacterium]|nr:hypothetical protein [Spirochaetaceae bacterium]
MNRYGLFTYLLPGLIPSVREATFLSLAKMDQQMVSEELDRGRMIYYLTREALAARGVFEGADRKGPVFLDVVRFLKDLLKPLVQPNRDVEEAVRMMFKDRGFKIPRRRPRHPEMRAGESEDGDPVVKHRRRRRRKPAPASDTQD